MSETNGYNGNGNGKKRGRKPKNTCTSLVLVRSATLPQVRPKKSGQRISSSTRRRVIKAYEIFEGNVSKVCDATGINRRTFYRWIDSPTPINEKFRKQLGYVHPEEVKIDNAELTISQAVRAGDVTAAIFTLKTKGRNRGWSERPLEQAIIDSAALNPVLAAYQKILSMNPDLTESERSLWIKDLASTAGVAEDALTRRIKVLELTAKV